MKEQDLIHDWNQSDSSFDWSTVGEIQLDDETLRDGLQNPSVVDPSIEDKIEAQGECSKLPRNSCPTRLNRRCEVSGRSKGYYR